MPGPLTKEELRAMQHAMNCPATTPSHEEDCTCGLRWREQLAVCQTVIDAAEKVNRGNVERAQLRCAPDSLYRDHMYADQRGLDEAFQAYYESLQPKS